MRPATSTMLGRRARRSHGADPRAEQRLPDVRGTAHPTLGVRRTLVSAREDGAEYADLPTTSATGADPRTVGHVIQRPERLTPVTTPRCWDQRVPRATRPG